MLKQRRYTAGPSRRMLDLAVETMQKYLGSVDFVALSAQQKLYDRVAKQLAAIAVQTGMSQTQVWEQVETQARRKGVIRPVPGKDI